MKRRAILGATALLAAPLFAAPASVSRDLNVEEQRFAEAQTALGNITQTYQAQVQQLVSRYQSDNNELTVTRKVAEDANALWRAAVQDVQQGNLDDRPLYWARLDARSKVKQSDPQFKLAGWQRKILLDSLEKASRGMSDINFDADSDIRILLTGFDPFQLDSNIDQSNPSGLAALAMDGIKLQLGSKQVQVETVLIPVRFNDFDDGLIESLLTPYFRDNSVDMVVTVSMGRSDFDLERFPGRNRSAKAADNLNHYTGASPKSPKPPQLNGKVLNGPEFVEFSLPVEAMKRAAGKFKINDNRTVTTDRGEQRGSSVHQLQQHLSVQGSGGGYLSNEISYRSVLLSQLLNSKVPVGHIHTPRVKGYNIETEIEIMRQLEAMLAEAAATL